MLQTMNQKQSSSAADNVTTPPSDKYTMTLTMSFTLKEFKGPVVHRGHCSDCLCIAVTDADHLKQAFDLLQQERTY